MTRVAIVDHGMGNLRSVARALAAAGAEPIVTQDPAEVATADALCVPGQGIFGRCIANLEELGLAAVVRDWIGVDRPFLGICLGMQILFDRSDEPGPRPQGLGVLAGSVTRLPPSVTVPHIGWNKVMGSGELEEYYFDHSYAVHPADEGIVTGWCEHGESFAAQIETGPILATQFHPEKSGKAGITLLTSWIGRIAGERQ